MMMPAAIVEARSVKDVQATVVFAKENKLRLTVKNGGHSYMGYCLNHKGIMLDLSCMKDISIDADKMTIRMQGGLVWKDVYHEFNDKDPSLIAIGGQCPTVGVSGFTLGGGLSPFSRSYGLACDNLLAMTIVTYEGEIVTATLNDQDKKKRDLFWALRGGGGGNFGVTVEMTCKIHKLRDEKGMVFCGYLTWNLPQQRDAFDKMMEVFNKTEFPDELTLDAQWRHGKKKQLTGGMTVFYNGDEPAAQKVLKPLLAFKPAVNGLKAMKWSDWVHRSEGWNPFSQVYHHHASFIFAEGAITQDLNTKISDLVAKGAELLGVTDEDGPNDPKCHILWDHIGGATSKVDPKDTAFPWRNGHYVSTVKLQWTKPEQVITVANLIMDCQKTLLPHAIEQKAAYINYIDETAQHWQEAYYNQNYPRLQQVKTDWDPYNFFRNPLSIELTHGRKVTVVHRTLAGDSEEEIQDLDRVQTMTGLWEKYGNLVTPNLLGSPRTEEEVYRRDAEIRREILKG